MTLSSLNTWRWVYAAETALLAGLSLMPLSNHASLDRGLPGASGCREAAPYRRWGRHDAALAVRFSAVLGAALWLMHDLAHGRWKVALCDLLALCALAGNILAASPSSGGAFAGLAAVLFAALSPERPPSPFIWATWRLRRG